MIFFLKIMNYFPLRLWSVRALLLISILFGLEIFPLTGIFIMFFMTICGPYLWGLIPHLITVGFLCDIKLKQLPKVAILIPLLIYISYYVSYAEEAHEIETIGENLRSENPRQIIKYDPNQHSLVLRNANDFVTEYKVPVTYSENVNFPEGYLSYRILPKSECDNISKTFAKNHNFLTWRTAGSVYNAKSATECIANIPAKPDKNILRIISSEQKNAKTGIYYKIGGINFTYLGLRNGLIDETNYDFKYIGQSIGTFKSASIERMPLFPFFIFSCELSNYFYSWNCFASVYRHPQKIDTFPDPTLRDAYNADPIRAMLQIDHYTDADFVFFQGYPENTSYIDSIIASKKNELPTDFNKWGVRKDSYFLPVIDSLYGVPSYRGKIYNKNEGGPFYDFIDKNQGKVVYIEAEFTNIINSNGGGIVIYGICVAPSKCIDNHYYHFKSAEGSTYKCNWCKNRYDEDQALPPAQIKGYWRVANTNIEGNNTRTI